MRKIKKSASRLDLRKMKKMPRKKCFFNYYFSAVFLTFFKNYFSIFNQRWRIASANCWMNSRVLLYYCCCCYVKKTSERVSQKEMENDDEKMAKICAVGIVIFLPPHTTLFFISSAMFINYVKLVPHSSATVKFSRWSYCPHNWNWWVIN